MIKAVIFDLDETLTDAFKAHYQAMMAALEKEGYTPKVLDWVYGLVSQEIIKYNFPDMEPELIEKIAKKKKDLFKNYVHTIKILPNAYELLEFLKEKGIRIVLITNNSHKEIKAISEHLKLENIFEIIVGKEDAEHPKPSRDPLVYAIHRLDLPLEEIIFVGDSDTDIAAARNTGIRVIVNTEQHKNTDLDKADFVARNLKEVKSILEDLMEKKK